MAILSRRPELYSTQVLADAARARGHDVRVLDTLLFDIVIGREKPELRYEGQPVGPVDAVIPRIGASITVFGMAVVRQFQSMGVYCLNSAQAIARSRDKVRALQLLTRRGIAVPPTVFTRQAAHVSQCMAEVDGPPVVVKLLEGTQGIGVMLAESERAAGSVVEAFHGLDQNIVIQKFIQEAKGADIRALVIGARVVAAMKRQAEPGEFRSNLHRGGTATRIRLSPNDCRIAVTAARTLGLRMAGVDMLESNDGPLVMEVNSSPGLEGIQRATSIDVADAVIAHVEREITPAPSV